MSQFEDLFKTTVTKIEDQGVKDSLMDIFKKMEIELGVRGRDLAGYKSEAITYKKLKETLKAAGVESVDDVDSVASKLKITKDAADEKEALTAALKTISDQKSTIEKEFSKHKIQTAVMDKFNSSRNQFKDENGKGIKIADDFIDKNKLLADIDVTNEVLVKQRVESVLQEAFDKQNTLLKNLELPSFTPPRVPEGSSSNAQSTVPFKEQLNQSKERFGNSRTNTAAALIDAVRKSQGFKEE